MAPGLWLSGIFVKKENYRARFTSLNNPTSSDMGFTLENEIQSALKPMLAKARNTNTSKFSEVITSLVTNQGKMPAARMAVAPVNPIFNSLMSLVGTLTVQEKKITREDLKLAQLFKDMFVDEVVARDFRVVRHRGTDDTDAGAG